MKVLYQIGNGVWYAILLVEALLTLRLGAEVVMREPAGRIFDVTDTLVVPMMKLLPSTLADQVVTFVSMLFYWCIAFVLIVAIARLPRKKVHN